MFAALGCLIAFAEPMASSTSAQLAVGVTVARACTVETAAEYVPGAPARLTCVAGAAREVRLSESVAGGVNGGVRTVTVNF
jgi:hypothetical protein